MDSSISEAPEGRTAPPSTPTAPPAASDASSRECLNCGALLTDAYCAACGQRAAGRVVPLWQVTNEFLVDLFSLDLCLLRTLPTFLFRPGRLTVEYVHGRRRRYIRPLRLYLFSSFLLFTVLALTNLGGVSVSFDPLSGEGQSDVAAARAELDAIRADRARQLGPDGLSPSTAPATPSDSVSSSARRFDAAGDMTLGGIQRVDAALATVESLLTLREQATRAETSAADPTSPEAAGAAPSSEGVQAEGEAPSLPPKFVRLLRDPGALFDRMLDRAPYLMFFLVPTFALLLKLLYLRRHRLYLEHLIFALHVHAFAFIALAFSVGLDALNAGTALHLDGWLATAPLGYLLLAMRRVYGQPVLTTGGKALLLLLAYGIILAGAIVILLMATYTLM